MPEYLLPLSVLHAAAPGVLDIIFGRDGDHENAPHWEGQLWHFPLESYRTVSARKWTPDGIMLDLALSALLPSTAFRLAGLCLRAGADEDIPSADLCWEIIAEAMDNRIHPETAARMVTLILRLAPEIAALKS